MTYVVVEPCIATKDSICAQVCPAECIYEGKEMFYIDPIDCIDCDACVPVCPVDAIYKDDQVPEKWKDYTQKNVDWFDTEEGREAKSTGRIMEGVYRTLGSDTLHLNRVDMDKVKAKAPIATKLNIVADETGDR